MADPNDNMFDKAEGLARRILERLGSSVDKRLSVSSDQTLNSRVIADLATQIERAIEANLKPDERGTRRISPNRFRVRLTYEETSKLSPQYIEAVGKELTDTAFEYINNRRYVVQGPFEVKAVQDLFAKVITIETTFSSDKDQSAVNANSAKDPSGNKRVSLSSADGRDYKVELKAQGPPVYIGRASESALRLDDPSVSRLHCSLSVKNDQSVVVADVGSVNGTYVNGQLLGRDEARALKSGDQLGVGDFRLTVSEIS
jgi:hypothetical protein